MSSFLVERNRELAELTDCYDKILTGAGNCTLISGATASGKTTLVQAYVNIAIRSGATVLSAIASCMERDLPFGVISQLFQRRNLPPSIVDRAARILQDAVTSEWSRDDWRPDSFKLGNVFEEIRSILVDFAEDTPLVIAIDDLQHADINSIKFILYLIRRIDAARISVVLTESNCLPHADPLLHADMISQPNFHGLRLSPLTKYGVAAMLSKLLNLDSEQSWNLSETVHDITGGNPMLTRALISDHSIPENSGFPPFAPGESFSQAVLAILNRCDPAIYDVARIMAILDRQISPEIIVEMLDTDIETTLKAIAELELIGLTRSYEFRNDSIGQVIVSHMTRHERAATHGRAAQVLHAHNASPARLARHLMATDRVDLDWAGATLLKAADRALAVGQFDVAIRYLRKAYDAGGTVPECADIKAAVMRAEWRIDPNIAARRLPDLIASQRNRHLQDRDLVFLLNNVLWHRNAEEASSTLDELAEVVPDSLGQTYIKTARVLLRCMHPGLPAGISHRGNCDIGTASEPLKASLYFKGVAFFGNVLADSCDDPRRISEEILCVPQLDDSTIYPKALALLGLIFDGESERAASWCHALLSQARTAPTWRILLSDVQAMIDLQRGDFISAEQHAFVTLGGISSENARMAIGGSLASIVLAEVAQGKYRQAAQHLGHPVPAAMFQSLHGLRYLHSRGRYHLAVGNLPAALADFRSCGQFTTRWRMQLSSVVPWRIDAAHTLLQLDDAREARELGNEQLARLAPRQERLHGMCMRILGITSDPKDRPTILQRAADSLRKSGDQFELACTLADLSDAYRLLGQNEQARITGREAMHLAKRCGAEPLISKISTSVEIPHADPHFDTRLLEHLSEAERRVAALALEGYTNRQISHRLHITVSTVEQHLTRVYRKLRIRRRAEIPQGLNLDPPVECRVRG